MVTDSRDEGVGPEGPHAEELVPMPRLSHEETRRRLLLVCKMLNIDVDSPEADALADLIARQADISVLDSSD